jgi:hypothetical protein
MWILFKRWSYSHTFYTHTHTKLFKICTVYHVLTRYECDLVLNVFAIFVYASLFKCCTRGLCYAHVYRRHRFAECLVVARYACGLVLTKFTVSALCTGADVRVHSGRSGQLPRLVPPRG